MFNRLCAAALCALALSGGAAQGAEQSADRVVYPADVFAQYSPQTALDIVERVPGFTIDAGADLRGFGGTAGNVIIDGQRPSAKSGGIRDVLRRIPAARVERVEVLRGGALTAEAQGHSVVVNVITRKTAASGTWSVTAERVGDGTIYPIGEASLATQIGTWDTSFKVNGVWERWPFRGRREVYDGSGALLETRQDNRPSTFGEAYVSGEASRAAWGGLLRFNGRFGWERFFYDLDSVISSASPSDGTPDFGDTFGFDSQTIRGEVGGDFSLLVAEDWNWKVLALVTGSVYAEDQVARRRVLPSNTLLTQTDLGLDQKPLEAIARTTLARTGAADVRPEFGIEIAYNRLNSALDLAVNGTPLDLPASNVLVEELRGEAFAKASWKMLSDVTVDGGLAVEVSRITVTGDAEEEQAFVFWKPSLAATWSVGPKTQLTAGWRHIVGQLDFTDFAASAQVQDDIPIAGNPSLKPTQTSRIYAQIDHRWGRDGAVTLEVFSEQRTDVLEYVILPSGGEGLSNAGDAEVLGLNASAKLPLDWAVDGAKLQLNAKFLASTFEDPLTGETRDINALTTPTITAEFRHDIPKTRWSWGLRYTAPTEVTYYYVDEIDRQPSSERYGAFVEHVLDDGLKINLTFRELATQRWERERLFFDPDRDGALDRVDKRWNSRGTFVDLTVSASF